jgi:molybdopterin-containing oxidoreductase family membrane subunit
VGWFTLLGGIIGFFTGFLLAIFTATRWGLIVSGKPVVALVPFFIVGFEFTILFAVFGNVVGLITLLRLPTFKFPSAYDPRTTCDRFGVLATCTSTKQDELAEFFAIRGGEVKVYEA